MARKVFTMTPEQMSVLLDAMKSVPLIMLQCGVVPTQQELANNAWISLGEEMGFDGMTVRPHGDNPLNFTAEPVKVRSNG